MEGGYIPGVWDSASTVEGGYRACEAQQVQWRVGTGHVRLSKYSGGWVYTGCVGLCKYGGGWVLGMWDSASTVHGGWVPGMYCFFKRWDDIQMALVGVHSPIQPPLTVLCLHSLVWRY